MTPRRRNAVNSSIQNWVEIINSSTPTKGSEVHHEASKLSDKAADTLFGKPPAANDFDRDLYELGKLADRVLAAVAANEAQDTAFRGAREMLPCNPPKLELTLPMPSWPQ